MAKGYLVVCYREVSDPAKLKTYAELAPKGSREEDDSQS